MAERHYQDYKRSAVITGGCEDWVVRKREDVYRAMVYPPIRRWVESGGAQPDLPTDAKTYTAFARAEGVRVDNLPRIGAMVIFQPRAFGAGDGGHAAYVEAVNADGSFVISEMNFGQGQGVVTSRTLPATAASNSGIAFLG